MKRFLSVFMLVLAALVLVTGCQKAETKPAEKTVLVWWGWFPTQEDFAVIEKDFEAENPNIDLQATRFLYDDYVTKLKTEFSGSVGPDVLSMKDGALLNDFKPYLADLSKDAAPILDKLVPSIVADAKFRSGGSSVLYAPLGMSSQMFVYYNATMFEKAGIAKAPTNAAEFKDAVAKIKKAFPDKLPFAIGLKDGWFATDFFITLANMVSPGITEKADKGEVKWNDAKFLEAMVLLQDLVKTDIVPKTSVGLAEYEDAIGLLMDGKAVMLANGSWNAGNLSNPTVVDAAGKPYGDRRGSRATDKDVMGAFPVPNFAGGNTVVIGGVDIGMAVNKKAVENPAKKAAVLKLLDFMAAGKGRDYFVGRPGGGLIPTLKGSSFNMTAYPDKASQDGVKSMTEAYFNNMVASREVSNSEVKNQLAIVLQNVINGKDPKAELDALQKLAEAAK